MLSSDIEDTHTHKRHWVVAWQPSNDGRCREGSLAEE